MSAKYQQISIGSNFIELVKLIELWALGIFFIVLWPTIFWDVSSRFDKKLAAKISAILGCDFARIGESVNA
jgi:hypothetical protein